MRCAPRRRHARPARDLRFDALEYWEKPQVLCATAGDAAEAPAAVRCRERLARSDGCGGIFSRHQTVPCAPDAGAKSSRGAAPRECEWPPRARAAAHRALRRFVLMQSRRGESGSIYSVVDSWPLYATDE